jgi:hypothetical protein
MVYHTNMDKPKTSRAIEKLSVQLGADLKREWLKWCEERGQAPAQAVRELVETALKTDLEHSGTRKVSKPNVRIGREPDTGSKVSREIQFSATENAAIEAAAAAQGFGFQEWVIAATRAALANAASYGQSELEELSQSNILLGHLVMELSAIRRAQTSNVLTGRIQEIETHVKLHMENVSASMAQGARRWQIKISK